MNFTLPILAFAISVSSCSKDAKEDDSKSKKLSLHEIDTIEIMQIKGMGCGDQLSYSIGKTEILEKYVAGMNCGAAAYQKKYTLTAAQHLSITSKVESVVLVETDRPCGKDEGTDVVILLGKGVSKRYETVPCEVPATVMEKASFQAVLSSVTKITSAAAPK